jgi:hypothetical protein
MFEVSADNFIPGPLAYYSAFHAYWSGSIKYCVKIYAPSTQKISIRATWYPDPTVTGVIVDGDAGDALSVVYDIVGDGTIDITALFLALSPQLRMPEANGAASNSTHSGVIILQTESAISSQFSTSNAGIGGTVYVAAGEDFQFSDMVDPPWVENIVFEEQASGVGMRKKPTRFHGKVIEQASIRDHFGKPFPTMAPATLKGTDGICNPDRTRGICDAMKRFAPRTTATTAVINAPPYFSNGWVFGDSDGRWLDWVVPFTFWSGSKNYKAFPVIAPGTAVPTVGYLKVIKITTDNNTTGASKGYGGMAWTDLSKSTSANFTIAYSDRFPVREIFDSHGLSVGDKFVILVENTNTTVADLDIWESMGDDFSLYGFHACPFIFYYAGAKATTRPGVHAPSTSAPVSKLDALRAAAKAASSNGSA